MTIYRILLTILLAALLCGCTDRLDAPDTGICEAGVPVQLTLSVDIGGASEVTSRADMPDGIDRQVKSLWVGIYNADTGILTGTAKFTPNDGSGEHDLTEITVEALSGPSYIVAVANYTYRSATVDASGEAMPLQEALERADTWERYCAISAAFDAEGNVNISAPLNPLLMSGFYIEGQHADGSRPDFKAVGIAPGTTALPGAIHLRRLISHVRFNVSVDTSNISNFKLVDWQVVNLPNSSWLNERDDADADRNAPDLQPLNGRNYLNSAVMNDVAISAGKYSFDFWQLENRRTGRAPDGAYTGAAAYAYREKEYKIDGANTGRYVSLVDGPYSDDLNNMATYVVFNVSMDMNVDEDGKPFGSSSSRRFVEATYVVHLGYCEGEDAYSRASDFNCRRNTRYTYNVTIRNVADIIVEASGDERNPAVEGFVSDISGDFYEVDAHYSAMNIYLSASDIAGFEYYFVAFDTDGKEISINSMDASSVPAPGDSRYKFLDWIELRPTTGQYVLAEYKPRTGAYADGKTYLLPDVAVAGLQAGWYTMFVDEYVYEDSAHADGNETGSTAWRGYVNLPERRVWLNVEGCVSDDGESVYYKSKYALAQSSIQSYYNSSSSSGLGVERVNESLGLNLRNAFNGLSGQAGTNRMSGRYNLAQYLTGASGTSLSWTDDKLSWSKFVNVNEPMTVNAVNNQGYTQAARTKDNPLPLPALPERSGTESSITSVKKYDPDQTSSPKYIEAITACLNRNRDLDGDGQISANEIRWFVPTSAQYVRIILGRRSLADPLMDYTSVTKLSESNNGYNSRFLLYASDGRMMWLMEGTSESEWRQWPTTCAAPWDVRCVRNLGGDMTVINDHNVTQPAFEQRNGTNIVDMKYYDAKSIREEAYRYSSQPMPAHLLSDQRYNRCYKSFEFFDSVIPLNDPRLGIANTTINWSEYLSKNNPCHALDYTGKSGWRVPNQKELTILGVLGVNNINAAGTTYQVSCTYSYFDTSGYAPGENSKDPSGSVSSDWRYPMKLVTSNGQITQAETMSSLYVNGTTFGVRCVRDVD